MLREWGLLVFFRCRPCHDNNLTPKTPVADATNLLGASSLLADLGGASAPAPCVDYDPILWFGEAAGGGFFREC